jgi:hypothetical protein
VGLFNKITELTSKKDKSPELKKGEVKQIIIRTAKDCSPSFTFLVYRNSCYVFQRLRYVHGLTVYETLHILFSLKNKNFCCSVASRLNPDYIFINSYNTGLINPHIDLKVLRHKTGVLNTEDAYYFHNGQVQTTTNVVGEIFSDFLKYGLPFLDKQLESLNNSKTLLTGLGFIDKLAVDKSVLKSDIQNSINNSKFGRVDNSVYNELKKLMLSTLEGRNKEIRDKIPKAAYELLEIYWNK